MDNVIDLRRLWLIVRRNGWLMILSSILFSDILALVLQSLLSPHVQCLV